MKIARSYVGRFITVITLTLYLVAGTSLAGCSKREPPMVKNKDYIANISFSADGKKILFDRCKGNGHQMIHVYDLITGELSAYQSPSNEIWIMAHSSPNGQLIVFVKWYKPSKGRHFQFDKLQLAIMDPNGRKIRNITHSKGAKFDPSFSYSNDEVIFIKAGLIRKTGKTPLADYDIYKVNINTGRETRLTWFKFFCMSPPYFFPDDERILISAFGPRMFPGIDENDYGAIQKKKEELKELDRAQGRSLPSGYDDVYIVKQEMKEFPDPLKCGNGNNRLPLVSRDDIYFVANESGDQVFQYSSDGNHRRVTKIPNASIISTSISPDGKYLAVIFNPIFDSENINKISIWSITDGTCRTIELPDQPSRIINTPQ